MKHSMKRYLLLIVAMIAMTTALVADEGYAQASFVTKTHDFGVIKETGGPVTCEFEFTNTGRKPLIVIDATASCGCTRPEFTTKPIKPGKKGKIKVTYNPLGRPGAFRKTVKVTTNGRERRTTLVITGTATPPSSK